MRASNPSGWLVQDHSHLLYSSQVGDIVQDLLGRHYHIATGGAVGADQFVIEKLLRLGVSERCTVYSPWQNYASLQIMGDICFGGRYPLKMSLTSLKLVSIFTIKKAAAKRLTLVVFPHECHLPEIDYVKWVQLKCGGCWEGGFKAVYLR